MMNKYLVSFMLWFVSCSTYAEYAECKDGDQLERPEVLRESIVESINYQRFHEVLIEIKIEYLEELRQSLAKKGRYPDNMVDKIYAESNIFISTDCVKANDYKGEIYRYEIRNGNYWEDGFVWIKNGRVVGKFVVEVRIA